MLINPNQANMGGEAHATSTEQNLRNANFSQHQLFDMGFRAAIFIPQPLLPSDRGLSPSDTALAH